MSELDSQLADGMRAIEESAELRESIANTRIEISRLDKKLDAPIFEDYKQIAELRQFLQTQQNC